MLFEIMSPIIFMTLSFPSAIQGKIVFTSARALRDLFDIKKKNGKPIEDHELTARTFNEIVENVSHARIKGTALDLIEQLTKIDDEEFRQSTGNYRNRANHQITPYIEYGERLSFARLSGDGFEGFSFGIEQALKLAGLVQPIKLQHRACCEVFAKFWSLTNGLDLFMAEAPR